jgi:hypothetical protein
VAPGRRDEDRSYTELFDAIRALSPQRRPTRESYGADW